MLSELWCGNLIVLALGAFLGCLTTLLTRFGDLAAQQVGQVTVSVYFGSLTAINALIFAVSRPDEAQQRVHVVKAVLLASNAGSALLGQILVTNDTSALPLLFDISAVAQGISFVCVPVLCISSRKVLVGTDPAGFRSIRPYGTCSEFASYCKLCVCQLLVFLGLRRVCWWTIWTVMMSPIHSIVLTYWQTLLRAKGITQDHNGYITAGMYLAAAVLTAVVRKVKFFRKADNLIIILSFALISLLLLLMAAMRQQLAIYMCLLVYQCIFEVVSAVCVFQVGDAVTSSTARSVVDADSSEGNMRLDRDGHAGAQMPTNGVEAHLTLLFAVQGVLGGILEICIQSAVGHIPSVSARFVALGGALGVSTILIVVASSVVGFCRMSSSSSCDC